MAYSFSQRSINNLKGVHPDLVKLATRAIELSQEIAGVDWVITQGLRTAAEQAINIANGRSQTPNSRHLTGHAIDILALPTKAGSWDWPWYEKINKAFKQASIDTGIPYTWGGDWTSIKDGVHFELPRKQYPA